MPEGKKEVEPDTEITESSGCTLKPIPGWVSWLQAPYKGRSWNEAGAGIKGWKH